MEIPQKVILVMNVSLLLISLLLVLNLFEITFPSLGKVQYSLDTEESLCVVNWDDQFTKWDDLDYCCLEARKQLECTTYAEREGLDWQCKTGEGKVLKYLLNDKAYRYCRQQEIWG